MTTSPPTTFRFYSPKTQHSYNSGTENFSSTYTFTFTELPPSEADSVVSSTSRSFFECQKLIVTVICLSIIVIYSQFIFLYFSSNENYIKQPIVSKYITNSSFMFCILLAIPLWKYGTNRMLLDRINPSFDTPLNQHPITPAPAVTIDEQNLAGIAENKTDAFLTLDKSIKVLLSNKASLKSLCQRYRVPNRKCCKQFGISLKYAIVFGFVGLSYAILSIWIQNHTKTSSLILLNECIFYICSFIIVLLYTSIFKQFVLLNRLSILSICIILIGAICSASIIYYKNAQQLQLNDSNVLDFVLSSLSGVMLGIFLSLIDYVSERLFYFQNVLILFGDILFMIALYGFVVFICLWPTLFIADMFRYENIKDIIHLQWKDICIATVIDFIFNAALFLSVALGNALFVSLNCMICLVLEIIFDILYADIISLNWRDWSCDILLFGLLLLIFGIILLNTFIIRNKKFSRLYCYQSCYYCCVDTRYKNGIAVKCHNICCKIVWYMFCFPCCKTQCCCCNYPNRDIQIHGCCVCGWSNKYEIIQVNPSTKTLPKKMVNQLMI